MIKRSFLGLKKPRFEYESADRVPKEAVTIPVPKTATLLFKKAYDRKDTPLYKLGEKLKTGQKIVLYADCDDYVISPVTGTISSFSAFMGDYGQAYTAVGIKVSETDEYDNEFAEACKNEVTLETLSKFLTFAPGCPPFKALNNPVKPINTLVVSGMDKDLLTTTSQYVLKSRLDAINSGVSLLKKVSEADHVVIALPQDMMRDAGSIGGAAGVELRPISSCYPSAIDKLVMKDVVGKAVPAEKTCEDMGVCFFSAEAAAVVGAAVKTGRIPVTKTITLIKKDLSKVMVEARIGTPISDIFNICDVTLQEKDRIILGGPMTGSAVYSETYPVMPDTEAIMVQDSADVAPVSDYPCVNCGECVRICPANVPVDMLVRFLEARKYQDAAAMYDLFSCIECGLCSYVCVSRMPIFQYIRLAKHELGLIKAAEATHG